MGLRPVAEVRRAGHRLAQAVERHPTLACALAGLALAAALPPLFVLPGLFGFAALFFVLRRAPNMWRAAAATFAFGFTFALGGLYWVGIAFYTDPTRYAGLAVPAVLALCIAYATTVVLTMLPTWWLRRAPVGLHAGVFALAWIAAEGLRASAYLRFPWNPVASAWAFSALTLEPIAYIGVVGLGFLTVLAAVLAGTRLLDDALPAQLSLLGLLLALAVPALGFARATSVGPIADTATTVRLVQANIPQHHKWDEALMAAWFQRHLELAAQPYAGSPPRLVVWPESAVPYDIDESAAVRDALARAAPPGGFLVVGADRFVRDGKRAILTNSLYVVDATGAIVDRYDKVDLVPFGEYLPFRRLLRRVGLRSFTSGSIDFTPGPGRRTIAVDAIPPFSPLICYEAAYSGRASDGSGAARLLVNITNDGWFGRSSGPYQHFAMARMRAVETGLPLVRAANTGISAIVDGNGRVRAALALGETGVVDGAIPQALPPPPVARWPQIQLMVVMIGLICSFAVDFFGRRLEEERVQ